MDGLAHSTKMSIDTSLMACRITFEASFWLNQIGHCSPFANFSFQGFIFAKERASSKAKFRGCECGIFS